MIWSKTKLLLIQQIILINIIYTSVKKQFSYIFEKQGNKIQDGNLRIFQDPLFS